MNNKTIDIFNSLYKKITDKTLSIVAGTVPNYVNSYVDKGRDYKRIEMYDEAVEMYMLAISTCGCIYTEVGRMFCKTICAMNEYTLAFVILFECAKVDIDYAKKINYPEGNMPSVIDFCLLRDCVVSASKGNLKPLFNRTKEVSGNQNYKFVRNESEIKSDCDKLCKLMNGN